MKFFKEAQEIISKVSRKASGLLRKDDLVALVAETTRYIDKTPLEGIKTLKGIIRSSNHDYARKGWMSKDANKLTDIIASRAKWGKAPLELLNNTENALKWFIDNRELLEDTVEEGDETAIMAEGSSIKKAAAVKIIDHMVFLSNFATELVDYLAYLEVTAVSGEDNKSEVYIKPKVKEILTSATTFAALASVYAKSGRDVVKDIKNMPDVSMHNGEGSAAVIYEQGIKNASRKMSSGLDTAPSGFVGNPLYHLGMFIEDVRFAIYEWRKENKQLMELRLMELRNAQEGGYDPKLAKQIEYYEEKIAKLDYKIRRYEGELNEE